MSTQDIRKLTTVIRSIELIEEKANILHSQYTTAVNENEDHQAIPIDDSNVNLQLLFEHLEQLLQVDLKNRSFLLNSNNKRNYWNFFSLALKDSKGLYDTVLYVLSSQDVKTSTGRGRLFLRYCLQNHCLGDVIQQSFMTTKIVNQFYVDECFWTTPTYMNRVIQALYQLSDLQFDLLTNSQCQLDLSWPIIEITEPHAKTLSNDAARMRNESSSSILSMNSVDSESIVSFITDTSNAIPITPTVFANLGSSINDGSTPHSLSSVDDDDDPENTVGFWREKCIQLEMNLQEIQSANSIVLSNDVEIQCSLDEEEKIENPEQAIEKELLMNENEQLKTDIHLSNEKNEQLQSEIDVLNKKNEELNTQTNTLNEKNEELKTEVNVLKEEMNDLNFQLSSISMQRSTTSDKVKDYERDIVQYQKSIENKDALFNELQLKYNDLISQSKAIDEKHFIQLNEQNKRIEIFQIEMEKATKILENERKSMDKERKELNKAQEQLEATLQEKTLDYEEMKRRLVKAVREKAELFSTIHSYELKLEEQQSKKWVADEEVANCTKCNVTFGWTVRRHHCRDCQKIFCNHCSNNWIQSPKANAPQYRVCDFCHDNLFKSPSKTNEVPRRVVFNNNETSDDVDLRFEVRPGRLQPTTDTQ